VYPFDYVLGRERLDSRGVPGEIGVVEQVSPLSARATAEESDRVDPVLWTAAGNGPVGFAAHGLERRRLDKTSPTVLIDLDTEASGQLAHLALQVFLQIVVMQDHHIEVA
jgi:hypothetical protein